MSSLKKTYSLSDVRIMPHELTEVKSRTHVDTRYSPRGEFPFIVAPMDTTVDASNYKKFTSRNLITCLPRKEYLKVEADVDNNDLLYISFTLDEFKAFLHGDAVLKSILDRIFKNIGVYNILLDVANGHMAEVFGLSKEAKQKYGDKLSLMVGNIANPLTIIHLEDAGVDFVRLGIGSGSRCLTTNNTGIHYGMFTLIQECYKKRKGDNLKLIADGGISSYGEICTALAAGADYVMMGRMFNSCLEACGETFAISHNPMEDNKMKRLETLEEIKYHFEHGYELKRQYRGMSTKEVQQKEGKENIRPSEGFSELNSVLYSLDDFVIKASFSLASSMSYCDSQNLPEFVGKQNFTIL